MCTLEGVQAAARPAMPFPTLAALQTLRAAKNWCRESLSAGQRDSGPHELIILHTAGAGDLNAELVHALERHKRKPAGQDRSLAAMVAQSKVLPLPAGADTWHGAAGSSEVDHIMVTQTQRHMWGDTEVPDVCCGGCGLIA